MYDSILKDDYSGKFAKAQAVPANTNANGANGPLRAGGTSLQAMRVTLVANEDITLADTKVLTMKLKDCATEGGSYADVPGASISKAASGATTFAAGTAVLSIPIPDGCAHWLNVNVATDDATASGKMDIILEMVPR